MSEMSIVLIGVIVGAILTYIFAFLTDKRHWDREQKKELQQDKRKAISQSLRWIDPMRNTLIIINSITTSFVKGNITHEELMKRWPNLISQLADYDVSHDLIPLLPNDIYQKCLEIIMLINDVLPLTVNTGQSFRHPSPEVQEKGKERFRELNEKLNNLQDKLGDFEDSLQTQFLATYKY